MVAWQGDEVVGGVLGWVDEAENEARGRRRGYVERIFTRRQWRRRGIAGALICEDLRNLRARGMHEGAPAFDADNPSGAGSLYASLGFRSHNGCASYRHTMPPTDPSATPVPCPPCHTATLLEDGRVLVVGGFPGPTGGSASSVEIRTP